ncbi:MAG: glycoside hydrolase family 65 protein [Acidimicrobiia bacterium]
MSDFLSCVRFIDQRYDFSCGELTSRFAFVGRDATAEVEVVTLCSRTQPSVALQQIAVRVDAACELEISAKLDPRGVPGRWRRRYAELPGDDDPPVDGALRWETLGGLATCGLAYSTSANLDAERRHATWDTEAPLVTSYQFKARGGTTYAMTHLTSLVPSDAHHQPDLQAIRLVARAARTGFERLRQENRTAWEDLWRGRVRILGGDERWQGMVDAAFYYLNSSAHASCLAGTHIFGLAQWHDYHYFYGHVMWDIEAFALPVLLVTQPQAAAAILDYRTRSLPAARMNAQLNGLAGLQFPWQSAPRRGEEAAPGGASAAAHEHHVTPNVALAFAKFAHATGDKTFDRDRAWPVLSGVAAWIESRVTCSERGFEIREAYGVAEREQVSDNSAYMNLTAKLALQEAIGCAMRNQLPASDAWARIAAGLVIPIDDKTGVIQDHDGFDPREEKGATPSALAAIFPGGYHAGEAAERATIEFYLGLADEYLGSPMLSALYPTWAAWIGDRRRAARFLEHGYAKFTSDRFMNVHEYRADRFPEQTVSGPFIANLAGLLLNCYYGLPGIELSNDDPATWARRRVVMPKGWDGIEVESLWIRGRRAHLIARHGDASATFEFHDAPPSSAAVSVT